MVWLQLSRRRAYEGRENHNTVLPLYFNWVWGLAILSLYAAIVAVIIPNAEVQPTAEAWWQRIKLIKVCSVCMCAFSYYHGTLVVCMCLCVYVGWLVGS